VVSHGWYRLAPFRWSPEEQVLRRKEALPEGVVDLEITSRKGGLRVRGAGDSEELRKRLSRMFQLPLNLSDFVRMTRTSAPHLWVEEQFRRYKTLPGIGPYGAAHLLAMDGRHDFIAVDTEFRRFVRERYHGGRVVKDATMVRRYAKWGKWKYLAYWSELWNG
jgi:endonuclease III